MSPDPTLEAVVEALKTVPERRLALIELARKVIRSDGSLDQEAVLFHMKELELAIEEAEAYSESTRSLVWSVKALLRVP